MTHECGAPPFSQSYISLVELSAEHIKLKHDFVRFICQEDANANEQHDPLDFFDFQLLAERLTCFLSFRALHFKPEHEGDKADAEGMPYRETVAAWASQLIHIVAIAIFRYYHPVALEASGQAKYLDVFELVSDQLFEGVYGEKSGLIYLLAEHVESMYRHFDLRPTPHEDMAA